MLLDSSGPFIFVGQVAKEGSFSGQARLIEKLVVEGKLKTLTINTSSPAVEARIQQQAEKDAILKFVLSPRLLFLKYSNAGKGYCHALPGDPRALLSSSRE